MCIQHLQHPTISYPGHIDQLKFSRTLLFNACVCVRTLTCVLARSRRGPRTTSGAIHQVLFTSLETGSLTGLEGG